jgi:hypothetical protein
MFLPETFLHWGEGAVLTCEAFNGCDLMIVGLNRQDSA